MNKSIFSYFPNQNNEYFNYLSLLYKKLVVTLINKKYDLIYILEDNKYILGSCRNEKVCNHYPYPIISGK
jgi:hypothetical protein